MAVDIEQAVNAQITENGRIKFIRTFTFEVDTMEFAPYSNFNSEISPPVKRASLGKIPVKSPKQ